MLWCVVQSIWKCCPVGKSTSSAHPQPSTASILRCPYMALFSTNPLVIFRCPYMAHFWTNYLVMHSCRFMAYFEPIPLYCWHAHLWTCLNDLCNLCCFIWTLRTLKAFFLTVCAVRILLWQIYGPKLCVTRHMSIFGHLAKTMRHTALSTC